MKYTVLLILSLLLIIIGCGSDHVCIKDQCFEVEIVSTPEDRANGLMYREKLDISKGMLFDFEKVISAKFWMKNTLIPLDIIWIDENFKIIYISENTPPCNVINCPSYGPDEKIRYVLEINAGLSEEYGFLVGDKVIF